MKVNILIVFVFLSCLSCVSGLTTYYMDLICGTTLDMPANGKDAIRLKLTPRSTYSKNMNCVFKIKAAYNERFMLFFKNLAIQSSSTCSRDYLDVKGGSATSSPYVSGLNRQCGFSYSSHVYTTDINWMTLIFVSDNSFQYSGFEMIITRYQTGTRDDCLDSGGYECDNERCISDDLTCNGNNPCGDYSDCALTGGAIAGIVVGCLIFVVIATIMIVCLRRRRRNRFLAGNVPVVTTTTQSLGTPGQDYNQPVPQQYPSYPTDQQAYPQQPYGHQDQPVPQQYPSYPTDQQAHPQQPYGQQEPPPYPQN